MGLVQAPPVLAHDALTVFHTTCPILSDAPILILYGPTSTTQATPASSSRIQAHILTPLGLQSYPRLAISPSSPLYAAVSCLPHDEQGDEVSRALAYSLFKYFSELSDDLKEAWVQRSLSPSKATNAMMLFTESHAAELTSRMEQIRNTAEVVEDLNQAFKTQAVSSLDLDIVLPTGSLHSVDSIEDEDVDLTPLQEKYAELINLFGERAFIPTSRLRRAPSRPTCLNKSATLSRSQKESLRREICEFVDTEESYVAKIYELVHTIAVDFRTKARSKASFSTSPSQAALSALFPPSLDNILRVNTDFFEAIRTICEETENDAIADIEASKHSVNSPLSASDGDVTGALAFAQSLLEWFPKFRHCYTDFIQASQDFALHLRNFTQQASSFTKRVQETGEQRLMSLLIEPVQRLPRYSLYIDNIVKLLPLKHAALKPLLRAKDIISEICAQDQANTGENTKVFQRLRELVPTWYGDGRAGSRLLTAVDLVELTPPFRSSGSEGKLIVALLFADSVMLLERHSDSQFSARKLLSELDAPSTQQVHDSGLSFLESISLNAFRHVECADSTCVQTVPVRALPVRPSVAQRGRRGPASPTWSMLDSIRVFRVDGSYIGNAARWSQELTKARVESRYPETLRESPVWEVREYPESDSTLHLFSAIREPSPELFNASVTIRVDNKSSISSKPAAYASVAVGVEDNGFYRLEIEATTFNHRTRDMVQAAEFMPVLSRRLNNILQLCAQQHDSATVGYYLKFHESILKSLRTTDGRAQRSRSKSKTLLSHSPVKAMANFFSSNQSIKDSARPKEPPKSSLFLDVTNRRRGHRKSVSESVVPSADAVHRSPSKARIVRDSNFGTFKMSQEALEQTFDSYVLALHARKGNVVGRNVTGRHTAEQSIVNELYNYLLEFPQDHGRAAQASVDVLFASFEQFLRNAWFEQMGLIIPHEMLQKMQEQEDKLSPVDYEYFLVQALEDLTPQNQRALRSLVSLLNELLSGTSNDGDRGALIAAITEMVVQDVNAHEFMGLFDRFVEDQEVLEGSVGTNSTTPGFNSVSTRSGAQSSMSSKTSSLSKRFGLSRENSNKDVGSITRFGSVLKTWGRYGSKSTDNPRHVLGRTRSVEMVHQPGEDKLRGAERPSVYDAFSDSRPQSSESAGIPLNKPVESKPVTPKAKRRSSLSDVHSLPRTEVSPLWSAEEINAFQRSGQKARAQDSNSRNANRVLRLEESPTRQGSVTPLTLGRSPRRFEETRHNSKEGPRQHQDAAHSSSQPPHRVTHLEPHKTPAQPSGTALGILTEQRPSSSNTPPLPTATKAHENESLARKARAQSPQKVKERIEQQKDTITAAKGSLQAELDKISEDLAALNVQRGGSLKMPPGSPTKRDPNAAINSVVNRLRALETKMPQHIKSLERGNATLEEEVAAALRASDRKAKLLDRQLREANSTNEFLFQSVQEQLDKVFESVKHGDGIEALKAAMQKSADEAAALRKENAKLKRENLGLRAKLGE